MKRLRIPLYYLLAALVLIPLLWFLREVLTVEMVQSALFAATIGLIASKNAGRGHLVGLLLVQLVLAVAIRGAINANSPFGSLVSRQGEFPLLVGSIVIVILGSAKMIFNKVVHTRFLHGGALSGIYAAIMAFAVLTIVCGFSTGQESSYGFADNGRTVRMASLAYAMLLMVVLLLVTSINWRGSVMPRFLRAPKPLPSLANVRRGAS